MPSGGNNAKPTAVLRHEGGYRADRHANRADVADAPGAPRKPSQLSPRQSQLWDAVASTLPKSAIGVADEAALVELVEVFGLMQDVKELLDQDPTDKNARISYSTYFDRWYRLAVEFGCTPRSRASLQVPPDVETEDNPFEDILNRLRSTN